MRSLSSPLAMALLGLLAVCGRHGLRRDRSGNGEPVARRPDTTPAPSGLDFGTLGLDFAILAPELKQPFFLGDGRTTTCPPSRSPSATASGRSSRASRSSPTGRAR